MTDINDGIIPFGRKKEKPQNTSQPSTSFGRKKIEPKQGIDVDIPDYTKQVVEEKWLMTIRRYPSGQSYTSGKMILLGRKPYERKQKPKKEAKKTEFATEDDLTEVSVL